MMRRYAITVGCLLATGTVFIILGLMGVIPDALGSGIAGFAFFAILIVFVYAYSNFQESYYCVPVKAPQPTGLRQSQMGPSKVGALPQLKPLPSDVLTRPVLPSLLKEQRNPLTTNSLIRRPHLDFVGSPPRREQRSVPRPATGLTPSASPARRIKPSQTGAETEEKRRRRDAESRLKTAPKELVRRAESLVARHQVDARSYLTYMVERERRIYPQASSVELLKHIINLLENPPRYPSHTHPTYVPHKLSFSPADPPNRISPWDFWNSRDFRDPPCGRRPGR